MRLRWVAVLIMIAACMSVPVVGFGVTGPNQVISSSIKPADGTSGQNVTVGSGVKTNHIQDAAVTNSKIADGAVSDGKITGPISASKIQNGVFQKKASNIIIVAKTGGDFTSITDAVNSLTYPAGYPAIIKVMPGTYSESNLHIPPFVRLQGAGREVTTIEVLDGIMMENQIGGNVINGYNSAVAGFTISSNPTSAAVRISGGSPLISDNIILGGSVVTIYGSSASPIITGNIISTTTGYGISDQSTGPSIIKGNIITGNTIGICIINPLATISENTITGCQQGIFLAQNASAKIVHNVLTNNGVDIYVDPASSPNISYNILDSIEGTTYVGQYNVTSGGAPR